MAGTLYNGFTLQATVTGGANTTATLTRAITFYDLTLYATGAQGGGTIKLTTAGDVTDALICAVDKTINRASTFDDANVNAAAASVVTFTAAGGAGTAGVCNALCYVQSSGSAQ